MQVIDKYTKSDMMFGLRRRVFLVEKFIHMLIVTRVFTTHLLTLQLFIALMALLLAAKHFKEGFTPTILALFPILLLQVFAEIQGIGSLQYVATILGGLLHFLPLKLYYLPAPAKHVGMTEDALEPDLYYLEYYPLDHTKEVTPAPISWNRNDQVEKMLAHINIKHPLFKRIGKIIMSFLDKLQLKTAQGTPLQTQKGIVFSHGRGGSPAIYSTILMHFAQQNYRTCTVQHHQVPKPGLDKQQAKRFREVEVQSRAAEIYQGLLRLNSEEIVLMGHSYGCATVIQAYHSLEDELRQKVTHIVLLDPWLFPLPQNSFDRQIDCPVLILANQGFIDNQDMHQRNQDFLAKHKNIEYIVWKNADHLHQSDMGFVVGNLLGIIKNSHLSKIMYDFNIDAIEKFLRGEVVEGTFGEKNLCRDYKPEKWKPETFTY